MAEERSETGIFEAVISRDLERIPVLEALHVENFNGQNYLISQVIVKNILTDFDRQLSRHLAATRGEGFPRYTVIVRFRVDQDDTEWRNFDPTHHASVPHALRAIAERAVSFGKGDGIALRHAGRSSKNDEGRKVALDREDVESLGDALRVCETLGDPDFMEISGDFDVILAKPAGDLKPVTMYLRKGSVSMPSDRGLGGQPFECPIAGFARAAQEDLGAQAYLAVARHALSAIKEDAVSDFRAAAEGQIFQFDRALGSRSLEGHRFDAASSLIVRLKAGLGDDLRGLSEAARITALGWATAVEEQAAQNRRFTVAGGTSG